MPLPAFGLNRFDWRSVHGFAADVKRAEDLGYGYAFIAQNPLRQRNVYVMMAQAALATSRIHVGTLLENPVLAHPAMTANGHATVDELGPGRTLLVYGVGDTAVRFLGKRPAKVAELEAATVLTRRLLAGEAVDVGARRPARLAIARPVPVWVAAGGPKTFRMAGRAADGVFLRVGRHPANIRAAIDEVQAGAREAGRDPQSIGIGLIFHVVTPDDPEARAAIARSMAVGYYEYTPALFDTPGIRWPGPPIHELQSQVWPDFHHTDDLVGAGNLVHFLPQEDADWFTLSGSDVEIAAQLQGVLDLGYRVDIVVPHPVPMPLFGAPVPRTLPAAMEYADFKAWWMGMVVPHLSS